MTIRHAALVAAGLVLSAGAPAAAQSTPDQQPVDTNADVLVLDHDFSAGGVEVIRVFLESRQVYRAELSTPDVTLRVRTLGGRGKQPRVYPFLNADSPSGASIVEVYPDADGDYEIRPIGSSGSGISTRLRLYRDVRASHRRIAVLDNPGWEIGVEVGGGWHSGFAQQNGPLPPATADPHGGSDIEACFSARSAPGIPRFSMCVLGVGYQSQTGAPGILWVYTEPRVRVVGRARRGASNWEAGALLRLGGGSIERASSVPFLLAPGLYLARHIRRNQSGAGWSFQASWSHATYKGFPSALGNADPTHPHSDRLAFGVGWYQ
jgi:hypothetical protein